VAFGTWSDGSSLYVVGAGRVGKGQIYDPPSATGHNEALMWIGPVSIGGGCYPNCDGSTGAPLLTANDFQCFLNKFASNDAYANCDGSTGNPLLTANDFQCFLNKFASNDAYANCDGSTGNPLLTANDFQCFLNKYAVGCP